MISEEGVYYHKAKTIPDGSACGIYIFGAANQKVEIHFNYLDVPCENGGLIAVSFSFKMQNFRIFSRKNCLIFMANF